MKTTSLKTTIAAVATAATLLTSGLVPVATAHAETVFVPGLTNKIDPKLPAPCATKPWLCGPGGIKLPPAKPTPPAPTPEPGMSAGAAAAIGIVGGIIAGAALANASKQNNSATQAHYDWCFANYKTYRAEDNSFMSNAGYRKPCHSPYL